MGFVTYVVGETITPAINSSDLLIIGSGSGETQTLAVIAQKAKEVGARITLITIYPDSTIGKLSDKIVEIKASTTKVKKGNCKLVKSAQIGANSFEQSLMIFCDATVIKIVDKMKIADKNGVLMKRHANLE